MNPEGLLRVTKLWKGGCAPGLPTPGYAESDEEPSLALQAAMRTRLHSISGKTKRPSLPGQLLPLAGVYQTGWEVHGGGQRDPGREKEARGEATRAP